MGNALGPERAEDDDYDDGDDDDSGGGGGGCDDVETLHDEKAAIFDDYRGKSDNTHAAAVV